MRRDEHISEHWICTDVFVNARGAFLLYRGEGGGRKLSKPGHKRSKPRSRRAMSAKEILQQLVVARASSCSVWERLKLDIPSQASFRVHENWLSPSRALIPLLKSRRRHMHEQLFVERNWNGAVGIEEAI